MTSLNPTEFGERSAITRRPPALTSPWLWWALTAVILLIDALRVPALVDRLRADVPADLVADVGDPVIVDIALRVGAYTSLLLVLLVIGLCALIGALVEPRILPRGLVFGRIRVGLIFCVTTAVMVAVRVLALFALPPGPRLAVLAVLVIVFAGVGAWIIVPRTATNGVRFRGALLAATTGMLPCIQ